MACACRVEAAISFCGEASKLGARRGGQRVVVVVALGTYDIPTPTHSHARTPPSSWLPCKPRGLPHAAYHIFLRLLDPRPFLGWACSMPSSRTTGAQRRESPMRDLFRFLAKAVVGFDVSNVVWSVQTFSAYTLSTKHEFNAMMASIEAKKWLALCRVPTPPSPLD